MKETKCFDSSAWLAYYFAENPLPRKYLESSTIISASVITIFEVDRKLRRLNYNEKDIAEFIEFMENRAIIVDTTPTLCKIASKLSSHIN